MDVVTKLDELGKPAWLGLMVLAFIAWWPMGLAILAFLIWSGRMACWKHGAGRWHGAGTEEKSDGGRGWWFGRGRPSSSSGNWAFDEYRNETLRRLEEEQQEFRQFLERLRHAKDKAEFDQFMADRSRRPREPDAQPQGG